MEVFSRSCDFVQVTSFMSPPSPALYPDQSASRACSQAAGGLSAVVLLALPPRAAGLPPPALPLSLLCATKRNEAS